LVTIYELAHKMGPSINWEYFAFKKAYNEDIKKWIPIHRCPAGRFILYVHDVFHSHSTTEKLAQYPMDRRMGGSQSWSTEVLHKHWF